MADAIPRYMPAAVMRKLCALAERRCADLADLRVNGRWARYYSQEQFLAHVREARTLANISQSMLSAAEQADPRSLHANV
jgi:hypothetical protein